MIFQANFKLPKDGSYTPECLESNSIITELIESGLPDKLNEMLNEVQKSFNTQFKLKKTFYCSICSYKSQQFINTDDHTVQYTFDFCQSFVSQTLKSSVFVIHKIIKYFKTFSQYLTCYINKNDFLTPNLVQMDVDQSKLKILQDCKEDQECLDYCLNYKMTDIPELFIGETAKLRKMQFFLKAFKPNQNGYFIPEDEFNLLYKKLNEMDEITKLRDSNSDFDTDAFAQSELLLNRKIEQGMFLYSDNEEKLSIDAQEYKKTKEYIERGKQRKIMSNIKSDLADAFNSLQQFQLFLTSKEPDVELHKYLTVYGENGLNPFLKMDNIKLEAVNADLTFYTTKQSNVVG